MADPGNEKIGKAIGALSREPRGKLLTHLNSCVRCGLCADSCMYWLSTRDDRFIPARKVELVSSVYRRYCTFSGKVMPGVTGARELDEPTVKEMVDLLFGACTVCGRCVSHCSIGVDIAYVVKVGRGMLASMGYVPATLQSTVNTALKTGNNMGIPTEELVDTLQWLEDELRDEVSDDTARIPVDEPGCKVLYTLNPREPKFFPLSISAMAKIFHAAGESWSLSTRMYDVTNYAYYTAHLEEAQEIARRLEQEMIDMKAGRCVLAECGHGSRAFRWEAPNYLQREFPFEVITSVELLAEYIRHGRIRLDPNKIDYAVTLHDPCNLVRSGGVLAEQRYILKQCVNDFREMSPNGNDNFCCGGGGGQLAMSEYNERRILIGAIKAEQIRKTGAKAVATPCHNCIDQLTQLNITYKLGVQIKTLAEIVADALVLD